MKFKRLFITILFLCTLMINTSLLLIPGKNAASADRPSIKCVKIIKIQEGDTLWSIADEYYTPEYKNINVLIKEIKECNHIDDTIYIGQNIIVPHYPKAANKMLCPLTNYRLNCTGFLQNMTHF